MIRKLFSLASLLLVVASCVNDVDNVGRFSLRADRDAEFYATIEGGSDAETKVFADSKMRVLWNADDRIAIFNKFSYGYQYRFTGEDGANAGGFRNVPGDDEFVTGVALDHIYAVYPYASEPSFDNDKDLFLTLPAGQIYKENSFGIGANTMVSVSDNNQLQFRNVGGYLSFKLYGEGISVKSISFRGKNGEKLAGPAKVTMAVGGTPAIEMQAAATETLTLTCETPVALGADAEHCTEFWFVVPPTNLTKGFTVTVTDDLGGVFEVTSAKERVIERNKLIRMSAMKVVPLYHNMNVNEYLTFTSEGTTKISLNNQNNTPSLYYSYDKDTWTQWDYSELSFSKNSPLYLCGNNPAGINSANRASQFTTAGDNFSVSGSMMALIDYEEEVLQIPNDYCFLNIFQGCTNLTQAPSLPATTLANGCYWGMFEGCTSLASAPELPATTMANNCYRYMFQDCTNLTKAPDLPSTSLAGFCYWGMFYGCSSLTYAPDLPATTLADACYDRMFVNCINLTKAPELPAMTLEWGCYWGMFEGCTSLASAPDLPATKLASECYGSMFNNCTSLKVAPELPATTMEYDCYRMMFLGSGLIQAPSLPATTLAHDCYAFMFKDCTNLETAPVLPATTMAHGCCYEMFKGCTKLTTVPDMAATTMAEVCCMFMFEGCTSLETAPLLPASTLAKQSYHGMFSGCSSLKHVTCLATDISAEGCVYEWLDGVASTGTFFKASTMNNWPIDSQHGIPEGWTVIDVTNYYAVDLGLSVKWASCNVGANSPEEYGDYFAWGETEPKEIYDWSTYKWCNGSDNTLTKYNFSSEKGTVDNRTTLLLEDDAAHANWGDSWRMPTDAEWTELRNNCDWEWTTQNGVYGHRVKSRTNSNSIFLPAAGVREYGGLNYGSNDIYSNGFYWSSSLYTDNPLSAWHVYFRSGGTFRYGLFRYNGLTVRPVTE